MTDRRGNTIDEHTDRFEFDPPAWWDTEGDEEQRESVRGLRGREVQIKEVITRGRFSTVSLKTRDEVFRAYLKNQGRVGVHFPMEWLKLID
jgi:hypothetical protein